MKDTQNELTYEEAVKLAPNGEFLIVTLHNGMVALLDLEFDGIAKSRCWQYHKQGYASGWNKKLNKNEYMHRVVMNAPEGMEVDHIDGDKLDNRKMNLRICTKSENSFAKNLTKDGHTSKYRGVTWNKKRKKWIAQIMINQKRINLGGYNTEEEAAQVYNKYAQEHFGQFSRLYRRTSDENNNSI